MFTLTGNVYEIEINEEKGYLLVSSDKLPEPVKVSVEKLGENDYVVKIGSDEHRLRIVSDTVFIDDERCLIKKVSEIPVAASVTPPRSVEKTTVAKGDIAAPLSGVVMEIKCKKGDYVRKGDVVALLYSMKMVVEIKSNVNGVVEEVYVSSGQAVKANQLIMRIKPD